MQYEHLGRHAPSRGRTPLRQVTAPGRFGTRTADLTSPAEMRALQRTVGNAVVNRLIVQRDCIKGHSGTPLTGPRLDLAKSTFSSRTPYGRAVYEVNSLLGEKGIPLSPGMEEKIAQNVKETESGEQGMATAHFKESSSFWGEGISQLNQGDFANAKWSFTGSLLNFVGGLTVGGGYDDKKRKTG